MNAIISTLLLATVIIVSGCVSPRYKMAKQDIPPATRLDMEFPAGQLGANLNTVITYNGPGSWKRDALWDEYVVTIRNPGAGPIVAVAADLIDSASTVLPTRHEPWALEKESKTLEQRYGEAFVRYGTPGILILGAGAGVIASTGFAVIGPAVAATSLAVGATLVALPVYYGSVIVINRKNKKAVEAVFNQRRHVFPIVLTPGEVRTGSLFFPMVPSPRSLRLRWTSDSGGGEVTLPLTFLTGLHVAPSPATGK